MLPSLLRVAAAAVVVAVVDLPHHRGHGVNMVLGYSSPREEIR